MAVISMATIMLLTDRTPMEATCCVRNNAGLDAYRDLSERVCSQKHEQNVNIKIVTVHGIQVHLFVNKFVSCHFCVKQRTEDGRHDGERWLRNYKRLSKALFLSFNFGIFTLYGPNF